jgi:hypothetical protein
MDYESEERESKLLAIEMDYLRSEKLTEYKI